MCVVKSNGYGHGAALVAEACQAAGVRWFGVASIEEALQLRRAQIWSRIVVLSYCNPALLEQAIQKNIALVVYDPDMVKKISQIAQRLKKNARVHLKLDTGTHRLGLPVDDALELALNVVQYARVELEGVFTHFADAENPQQSFTNKQLSVFEDFKSQLLNNKVRIPYFHAACSAATILNARSRSDMVRVGISLYGLWSIERLGASVKKRTAGFKLRPVLSWHTEVIQVKTVEKGGYIGYGRTFHARKKMKIALIPVGYWEGYDRKLSHIGHALLRSRQAPIVGRICMNLTMLDVTHLPTVKVGDRVTLIGRQGTQEVTADMLAKWAKTINYEIVTRINPLIPRILV